MPDAPGDASANDTHIEIGEIGLTADEAGGEDQKQPVRRSPLRRTLLLGLLGVAVVGAGLLGYEAYQIVTQKDAKLATPAQIGTLTLNTSEDAKSTADYLQTAIAAEITMDKTIGAVYTDGGNTGKDVLLFGGTTLFWTPENDLDAAFDLIGDNEGAVTDLHEVSAGPLGGTMKCGTTKTDSGPLTVCGWSDHGSLAMAMFNNRTEPEASKTMLEIRKATETR
ncbi:hypothetical protein ODJ79_43215 [Actinoplanes sp. KI2]|uniref:hypothetical protein n=1 Tax=Actinoplanes sp. KI2 TaxID=2983315 RepID=UPI0021D5E404|nr:hypothetical protein [Actinoplanes sp. KI2]MCU7730568.1 hypothetical protein [Actinoplanes sp. KI2]